MAFPLLLLVPLALNLLGTKAIIAYVVVIVALVAVALYTRRGAVGR